MTLRNCIGLRQQELLPLRWPRMAHAQRGKANRERNHGVTFPSAGYSNQKQPNQKKKKKKKFGEWNSGEPREARKKSRSRRSTRGRRLVRRRQGRQRGLRGVQINFIPRTTRPERCKKEKKGPNPRDKVERASNRKNFDMHTVPGPRRAGKEEGKKKKSIRRTTWEKCSGVKCTITATKSPGVTLEL